MRYICLLSICCYFSLKSDCFPQKVQQLSTTLNLPSLDVAFVLMLVVRCLLLVTLHSRQRQQQSNGSHINLLRVFLQILQVLEQQKQACDNHHKPPTAAKQSSDYFICKNLNKDLIPRDLDHKKTKTKVRDNKLLQIQLLQLNKST